MKKIIALFLMSIISFMYAADPMQEAQLLYDASDYRGALTIYDSLNGIEHQNADILYNQALCHYKLDHLAWANYYLHLALKLDYGNSNYHQLLSEIRGQLYDHFENEDQFYAYSLLKRFLYLGNTGLWAILSVIFLISSMLCFAIYKVKKIRTLKAISNLNILGFIFMISLHFALIQQKANQEFVIVKENNVVLINEPTAQGEKIAVLHEGSKLSYIEQKGDYYEIALPNGQKAYILKSTVFPVWFPY